MTQNEKRANFRRLAEHRTKKVLHYLSLLSNLSNTSYYEYSEDEFNKIKKAIRSKVNKMEKDFADGLESGQDFRF